jgi:hypothetical protein
MDRHELAALKTERLEAQRAAKIEDAFRKVPARASIRPHPRRGSEMSTSTPGANGASFRSRGTVEPFEARYDGKYALCLVTWSRC